MKVKVEAVSDTSTHRLTKHIESILNNPHITVLEVHYVADGLYYTVFIHYREKYDDQ